MAPANRYGRERLPSKHVQSLRTNSTRARSTRRSEPRSKAASGTTQPVTRGSPQPGPRKQKRRRSSTDFPLELELDKNSPEPESDFEVGTPLPTSTSLSQPALQSRKRKRSSDMLSGLEPQNTSPEPQSEADPETPEPSSADSPRKSTMVRELQAHNESPEQDSGPDDVLLRESTKQRFFTRSARHKIVSFLNDKTPTPPKNLNVDDLMFAELGRTQKGTKTFSFDSGSNLGHASQQRQPEPWQEMDVDIEGEDEEGTSPNDNKTGGLSHSQPRSTRRKMSQQSRETTANSQLDQDVAIVSPWSMWDIKKARTKELLEAPEYGQNPSQQEMNAHRFQVAFHVEEQLHIFTPTAADFSHFKSFLKHVEEVAGRVTGVVKVIVPSECLLQTPTPGIITARRAPVMKAMKISLRWNKDAAAGAAAKPSIIYNMLTTNDPTSLEPDDVLHMIQCDKDNIIKECTMNAEDIDRENVWRGKHALRPYTEEQMVQHSDKKDKSLLCSLYQRVTPNLRAALRCKDPNIENFLGNRFDNSRSTEAGINEPVFHVATGAGPLSPLQTNRYAACSLNYHHSGAPRTLTVIMPKSHAKLEDTMYSAQDSGHLFVSRGPKPSPCSQFVSHGPMYVASKTLTSLKINHTEVVQHQGEMVIIFPWAYHQAYTSGPNITEEMMYASDRCKIFHQEDLYRHCGTDCAAGQPDEFDLALVFFDTLSGARSDGRYRPDQ